MSDKTTCKSKTQKNERQRRTPSSLSDASCSIQQKLKKAETVLKVIHTWAASDPHSHETRAKAMKDIERMARDYFRSNDKIAHSEQTD